MMNEQVGGLTDEDYRVLFEMSRSPDPDVRGQAKALAHRMTPQESQAFFDFQQTQQASGPRVDRNILGVDHDKVANWGSSFFAGDAQQTGTMAIDALLRLAEFVSAPEVAVGIPGVMKGADATLGTASRLGSGAMQAGKQAIRKSVDAAGDLGPDALGMISPRMGHAANIAQKLRERVRPTAPAVATPPGSPVAAPPPSGAAAAPPATPLPSSFRLTPEESQAFQALRAEGIPEERIFQEIAKFRAANPSAAAPMSPAPVRGPGKVQLQAAETKEYQRLLKIGKSPQEAMDLILAQRAFVAGKGLPSAEAARRQVADRNATGRWRDE